MRNIQFNSRNLVFAVIPFALVLISLLFAAGSARAAQLGGDKPGAKPVSPASASCAISFGPSADFATITNPGGVAVADFNGDGLPDVVVASYLADGKVSILLGNGDGTLRAHTDFAAGSAPYSVVTGDFNGDGRADVAVGNGYGNNISVLLGNGDGTLRAQQTFATGNNAVGITAGDFNGDGRLDLATSNYDSDNVSALLGNGDGTFRAHMDFAAGISTYEIVAGDFNGDGRLDLAATNASSNNVSLLLGNGDGTFRAADFATGAYPTGITAGDFNGDGRLDLATANYSGNTISVLLGNGDGTLRAQTTIPVGNEPLGITAADFSGDGRLDLVVTNYADGNVTALLGVGNGTFTKQGDFTTPVGPARVVAGDFNHDGRLDIAVPDTGANKVSILLNNCGASPAPTDTPTITPVPATPTIGAGCISSDTCPSDYWFTPVQYLEAHGAISGYSDNTFRPFNNATRGQLAKIVVIAENIPQITPNTATFIDTPVGSPFFTYVESAVAKNIISGYINNQGQREFRPGNNVTRGQIAKIIVVAAGWNQVNPATATFTDVAVGSPFYQVVETAVAHGIISGYTLPNNAGKEFRPGNNATRGQIAKIVYLALTNSK